MISIENRLGCIDSAEDCPCLAKADLDYKNSLVKRKKVSSVGVELLKETKKFLELDGLENIRSIRMLKAHGNSESGVFIFVHYPRGKMKVERVEDWIKKHDGNYNALAILSCNTQGVDLFSRKSVLIYPRSFVSDFDYLSASATETKCANGFNNFFKDLIGKDKFVVRSPRLNICQLYPP